jgi:hypothetical protein
MIRHRGALRVNNAFHWHILFRGQPLHERLKAIAARAGDLKIFDANVEIGQWKVRKIAGG